MNQSVGRTSGAYGPFVQGTRIREDGLKPPASLAAAPAPEVSERTDRPGLDRFSAQEAPQFVRQFLGAAVTAERLFLQTFEANGFQIAIEAWVKRSRPGRFLF